MENICLNCGEVITRKVNKMYCSRSCKNKHLTRKAMEEAPKYLKKCPICGKEFLACRPRAIYCSVSCRDKKRWQIRKEREGRGKPAQGAIWEKNRQRVFHQYYGKCWACEKELEGRWEAHHLEPNDKSPDAERVLPLCPYCHNKFHKVTISFTEEGEIFFYGEMIELVKKRIDEGKYLV